MGDLVILFNATMAHNKNMSLYNSTVFQIYVNVTEERL